MGFLIFATEKEATERSRMAWESVLGRKKNPKDVTEFLWGRILCSDGSVALDVSEQSDKLTAQEEVRVVSALPSSGG